MEFKDHISTIETQQSNVGSVILNVDLRWSDHETKKLPTKIEFKDGMSHRFSWFDSHSFKLPSWNSCFVLLVSSFGDQHCTLDDWDSSPLWKLIVVDWKAISEVGFWIQFLKLHFQHLICWLVHFENLILIFLIWMLKVQRLKFNLSVVYFWGLSFWCSIFEIRDLRFEFYIITKKMWYLQ